MSSLPATDAHYVIMHQAQNTSLFFEGFSVLICSLLLHALFLFQSHKLQLGKEMERTHGLSNASAS